MIELRWYQPNSEVLVPPMLQYRQRGDSPQYEDVDCDDNIGTVSIAWSDWQDVPTETEE